MKNLYLSFILISATLSSGFGNAQNVNIPDENFKTAVLSVADLNGDGEIQVSEAGVLTHLDLSDESISDMTGIAAFNNLETLDLYNNNISSIDLSQLTALDFVDLSKNELSQLDVSNNVLLEQLWLDHNNLESLDVTQLDLLEELFLDDNGISQLDVSNNLALKRLELENNNLENIDLSALTDLRRLYINNNNLSQVDFSNNSDLLYLQCNSNNLNNLDVSNSENLSYLAFNDNSVASIDLAQNPELMSLDASLNELNQIDLSHNPDLDNLNLQGNSIEAVDLSANTALRTLYVGNDELSTIDLSNNLDLEVLGFETESMNSIDFSENINLKLLTISGESINSIDLSNNTQLFFISINSSSLTDLDLSNNVNLYSVELLDLPNITTLNLKNGNNQRFDNEFYDPISEFSGMGFPLQGKAEISNCPNLNSICVDDTDYAINNFVDVEPNVTYTEDCPVNHNSNLISGLAFYDNEGNGCDPDEAILNGYLIEATNQPNDQNYITAFSDGNYNIEVGDGEYSLEPLNLPDYVSATPQTASVNFEGFDNTETIDFCLTGTQTIEDLNIRLLPIDQARPGFDSEYQLIVENIGTQTVSDISVTLSFDNQKQTFLSAIPNQSSLNENELSFTIDELAPFMSKNFELNFENATPPTLNGDDVLDFTASVTPNENDNTPEDNEFNLDQTVVNSFDPNDKKVLQGTEILEENSDNYLDYMIRFQNTGTASAVNVRLADTLDEKLDWTTLRPVSSSHDFRVEIDAETNSVQFFFDNINLPQENIDTEGSQGFVAFKIKPMPDVELGDIISNKSYIYFDFNEPIITNTTTTEIVDQLSVKNNSNEKYPLTVYPNPTKDKIFIDAASGLQVKSIDLYDIQGQALKSFRGKVKQLDLENLETGVYFIKIKTSRGLLTKRIIKQ